MARLRLGLDLGVTSIGWSLLELGKDGTPVAVFRTGVRIFTDGRKAKGLASLKAVRREARQARRQRDWFLRREKALLKALVKYKLMPADEAERKALALLEPYEIRKEALEKKLPAFHIGRGLFHLNKRRGFRSSRKSDDKKKAGIVAKSIEELQMKMGSKTLGVFLADRRENNETVRARRVIQKSETADDHQSEKKPDEIYELYPQRLMLEQEFDAIWAAQKKFAPALYHDEAYERIKHIIFYQRPLRPQKVGRCTFLTDECRAPKALPSFQHYRIYQELNNLQWLDRQRQGHALTFEIRNKLFNELDCKQKKDFSAFARFLRKEDVVDYEVDFNLQSERRKHLDGNLTACAMRKIIGAQWDALDEEQQDELVVLILQYETIGSETKMDKLKADFGITKEHIEKLLNIKLPANQEKVSQNVISRLIPIIKEQTEQRIIADFGIAEEHIEKLLKVSLPSGHAALSLKAIRLIIPGLRDQGLLYDRAVEEAGLGKANLYDADSPVGPRLDYYGKALQGHVLPGSGDPEESDEQRYGTIPNPTVHICLNQVRQVVNDIIRHYGKPEQIVLEIARDLPQGAKLRNKEEKMQRDNYERNQKARKILEAKGYIESRDSLQKYKLWEELSADPTNRQCVFTGRMISMENLFSDEIEIEHLLPFSQTLDDSMANKTVCYRKANRDKGARSPFEAFGESRDGYDWEAICARAKTLPGNKRWRFNADAMERYEREESGFLDRHLNDTKYISRYTREYLTTILPENKIWVVTGRLTALLRKFWGLNTVLPGHNRPKDEKPDRKNRDDHRHHAVDAVVIAMIERGTLQKVSKAAGRSEELNLERLFEGSIDPWDGFRDEVRAKIGDITVSHRPRRKNQGALHNETAYGLVEKEKEKEEGESLVVYRKKPEKFKSSKTLELIRDPLFREAILEATKGLSGKEFQEAVASWFSERGIRALRVCEKMGVIGIKDREGKIYKAYKPDSNAFMDIYPDPEKEGKWASEIVARFDANQKNFIPHWQRRYPALKRLMRLRINDLLSLDMGGERQIFRIQQLSGKRIFIASHHEARVDKFVEKTLYFLQKADARRVHISPAGFITEETSNARQDC